VTLFRPLKAEVDLAGVRLNGREVAFSRTTDLLSVHLPDLARGEHRFELRFAAPPAARPYQRSLSQRTGIALRRTASEFRDRVLARHAPLLGLAQRIARFLRLRR
jgi:hypothetical protein